MDILKHCDNEYFITMKDDTNLESLEPGLDKLVDEEVVGDWDTNVGETMLDIVTGAQPDTKEIHIYIEVSLDTEKSWKRIGDALGMSLLDLHHAKKLVTKVYRARFDDIPEDSLWDEPMADAEPTKDCDGSMITLGRMAQLQEETEAFLNIDWLDEVLLFYLDADEGDSKLLWKIENLLLMTKEYTCGTAEQNSHHEGGSIA